MAPSCDMAGFQGTRAKKKVSWRRPCEHSAEPIVLGRRPTSPESIAGFLSKLTFSWIGALLTKGYRRQLSLTDIPLLNPSRRVNKHNTVFKSQFAAALASENEKNPLFSALHKTFFREFWIGGCFRLATDLFTVGSPYTLRYLIQFIEDSYYGKLMPGSVMVPPLGKGIGLFIGILLMQILQSLSQNHFLYSGQLVGGQIRAVLTAQLLEKSMRISERAKAGAYVSTSTQSATTCTNHDIADQSAPQIETEKIASNGQSKSSCDDSDAQVKEDGHSVGKHHQGWSNGKVVNLASVDTHRVEECLGMLHVVWTSPIMILTCMALLIVNMSYSALAGLGLMLLSLIFLVIGVKALYSRRQSIIEDTDARISLIQEALQSIRLVKYFSWEESFIQRLSKIRADEVQKLKHYLAIYNAVTSMSQSLPTMIAMVSFVTFALGSGKVLDAATVFSSVALFTALLVPVAYLPGCLGQASDAWVSLKRIEQYLVAEEIEDIQVASEMEHALQIDNVEFTRDLAYTFTDDKTRTSTEFTRRASQKGSMMSPTPFSLQNISMDLHRGELVAVIGSSGSGKSSLLAGITGDMRKSRGSIRFASKLAYCPQTAWIQSTTVRNNITFGKPYEPTWYNIVISACQLRRDLEILPDGDATEIGERGVNLSGGQKQRISLARAIYSKAEIVLLDDPLSAVDPCVGQAIFKDAIVSLLHGKSRILVTHQPHVLKSCDRILWMEEGRVKALDTLEAVKQQFPAVLGDLASHTDEPKLGAVEVMNTPNTGERSQSARNSAIFLETIHSPKAPDIDDANSSIIVQTEKRTPSGIPWPVWHTYIRSSSNKLLVILAVPLLILSQGGNLLCGLWLAWWTLDRFGLTTTAYVGIYGFLAVAQGILLYIYSLSVSISSTTATNRMFETAMRRVMHAPSWFFDVTPLGSITNRFSKDIEVLDDTLPEVIRLFLVSTAMTVGILGLIVAYFHWFAVVIGPCALMFWMFTTYYRSSARELKYHETVLRGSVVARFAETLSGVTTIRNYFMQSHFLASLELAIDDCNSAGYLTLCNQRWLALRLDIIGIIFIITCGVLALVSRFSQHPAISGLVLSFMLGAMQVLQFVVRQWTRVESAMNSTERIYEYSSNTSLPAEESEDKVFLQPPEFWPERGVITFNNVSMRHRPELPEILSKFNLTVQSGEHLAIVGRTGAGKSSLVSSLFRLCELSEGAINIDGVDISQLSLHDLRSALSIQPQDPTLFRGTVRSNLDPFLKHDDETLWAALRGARLAGSVHLDDPISEEGSNLSLGQLQQLGLARLIVRNSKIIICDEATSSIDWETDKEIQQTMVELFKGKTVLTVAHRMRTIIHYDRVCVLERGRIMELGTPLDLWKSDGLFKGMCEKSGISENDFEHDPSSGVKIANQ